MNDLENIVPFFFLGQIFCMIAGPQFDVFYAKNLFRVFAACRLVMTICHYYCIQVIALSSNYILLCYTDTRLVIMFLI